VTFKGFLKSNFAGTGYFKALLGAGVGFNLWHYLIFIFTPCRRLRTNGELMGPCGQYVLLYQVQQNIKAKRDAKVVYFIIKTTLPGSCAGPQSSREPDILLFLPDFGNLP